jgi:hypothetical protein
MTAVTTPTEVAYLTGQGMGLPPPHATPTCEEGR